MHLSDEQLQRFLHGELSPDTARAVNMHAEACSECHPRLEAARLEDVDIDLLLTTLDHPEKGTTTASAIRARVRRARRQWMQRVAAIALLVGAGGVAWAAPRSALPRFVRAVLASLQPGVKRASPRAQPAMSAPAVAGISVTPGADLVLQFTVAQSEGDVRVSLVDGADVMVRAPVAAASFTSTDGRVVIDNTGSRADFEIDIPRSAPHVEIRIGSRPVFVKRGPSISAPDAVERESTYAIGLASSRVR